MKINTATDFTLDTPHYWDNFWTDQDGLGIGGGDPDSLSKNLQLYHQIVWSRELPCGDRIELQRGTGPYYLTWKDFRFGSDSIIVSFRYEKYRYMLDQVKNAVPDYRSFVEDYLHRAYTIGGMMIFPKHAGSINQAKGTNKKICDRWDLTLECIRRYYAGEASPISSTLVRDKEFFDLFHMINLHYFMMIPIGSSIFACEIQSAKCQSEYILQVTVENIHKEWTTSRRRHLKAPKERQNTMYRPYQ